MRSLVLVLGDQLDLNAAAFDGFDASSDAVWMAEVAEESTHVWSSKPRTVMFLAAMRHFADALRQANRPLHYRQLDPAPSAKTDTDTDTAAPDSLATQLQADIRRLAPTRLVMTAPGDWRVLRALREVARAEGLLLEIREDRHFYGTVREFAAHAKSRPTLRMEFFYREQRIRHGILMDPAQPGQPLGGRWNFDTENRASFGTAGPGPLPPRPGFAPDSITREVIALVERRFAEHPGRTDLFDWPVNRPQALEALHRFIAERLPCFGRWQDAIWPGEPWLYHAQLSAALNLKLLDPREVVDAAIAAHAAGKAPLPAVEGFVRQILGWREYVRGIYWTQMPRYLELNALEAHENLPGWYWTGDTDMACLREAIQQTLAHGYAHHIQRLMVTGLYALLLGVEPRQVHGWYLAVYVDAVEWAELPNTLGMSQYADAGLMGSKPYIATGKYLQRMSPHCSQCRYDPAQSTGADACPFTTLYWDFLLRHQAMLAAHPRLGQQVRHLSRLTQANRQAVVERAGAIRRGEVGSQPAGPGGAAPQAGSSLPLPW